ncbi:MAG: FG-GAP repeat protein [FCB group bacterium]|nr:FG-GAP repeat protein [FCB group bacterium]
MSKHFPLIIAIVIIISPSIASAQPQTDNYIEIWHCSSAIQNSEFGKYLVSVGDQNQDGYDDILVSAWNDEVVYFYFGGNPMDTIPDLIFDEPHQSHFGYLPENCRDLNGDGFIDFSISADVNWEEYAKIYVYFGGPDLDTVADLIMFPDSGVYQGEFGKHNDIGDFNGDGFQDLVVGDSRYQLMDAINGKIYVYYGGMEMNSICDWSITAEYNNIHDLAHVLSSNGDVNGDGFDDILTLGWYPDNPTQIGWLLFSGGSEPDTIPDWIITGDDVPGLMKPRGLIQPDINNNSFDEIIIASSAPGTIDAYIFKGGNFINTQ